MARIIETSPAGAVPKTEGTARPVNKKHAQAAAARETICDATIACLDEYGYAETSINRITQRASISRGALTHHFQNKEDLIVETADRLLERGVRAYFPARAHSDPTGGPPTVVASDLLWLWESLVDTSAGRAFLEILNAARTDKALERRIEARLRQWNDRIDQRFLEVYESADGDDATVRELLTICRVFFRGLLLHERFVRSDAERRAIIDRFIDLIAPQLQRRDRPRG